jgi:chromatin modification-related protein VID21
MAGAAGSPQMAANLVANAQMNNGNTPQGQMQGMQGQQRMAMPGHQQQPDPAMMMRAQRISEQQRQAVQMQQAQQHQQVPQQHHQQHQQQHQGGSGTPRPSSQHNSPPNMANGVNGVGMSNVNGVVNGSNGLNNQNFVNNAQAMMAGFNNVNGNGHTSPPANMYMAAGSPGSRSELRLPSGFEAHVANLEAQFRLKHPNLKPDAARHLAMEQITRAILAQRQNAMTAAAGGAGRTGQQHGIASNMNSAPSPHQYAALLRQQQQQQAQQQAQQQQRQPTPAAPSASSPAHSAHNRQSSEGATPGAVQ